MASIKFLFTLFIWTTTMAIVRGQGSPNPLSDEEQAEMFILHNQIRRELANQINVQCMVATDAQLIQLAQTMANTCNPAIPANGNIGYAWAYDATNGTALDVFQPEVEQQAGFFNMANNDCDPIFQPCDIALFRQVTWFEGGKLGCGRAHCADARSLMVCAYSIKQNSRQPPFFATPNMPPCVMCPARMNCVRYLCCAPRFPVFQYISTMPPVTWTPLGRLFNKNNKRNFLITDPAEATRLLAIPNVRYFGVQGQVATAATPLCQFLLPINRLYYAAMNSESTVVDPEVLKQRLSSGWTNKGVIGYAVQGKGVCGATVPIHEYYKNDHGYMQLMQGADANDLLLTQNYSSLQWHGVSYYVWP